MRRIISQILNASYGITMHSFQIVYMVKLAIDESVNIDHSILTTTKDCLFILTKFHWDDVGRNVWIIIAILLLLKSNWFVFAALLN